MAKDDSTPSTDTTNKASDEEGVLSKLKGTAKIKPSDIGKSPAELRGNENSYEDNPPVPDPEQQPIAAEAAGAIGYAGASQESYNAPYRA
jgi:hypothetical protein